MRMRIRIRDPGIFLIRDPGIFLIWDPGWKKSDPGIFLIRDPGWKKLGSRIWDKHPESATLQKTVAGTGFVSGSALYRTQGAF